MRVICAQYQKHPDIAAAHAVKITGCNGIEGNRDRADAVARKHDQKELRKLFPLHFGFPEDQLCLFHGGYENVPQLAHFVCFRSLPVFPQADAAILQLFRQTGILQESGECTDLVSNAAASVGTPAERKKRCGDPIP